MEEVIRRNKHPSNVELLLLQSYKERQSYYELSPKLLLFSSTFLFSFQDLINRLPYVHQLLPLAFRHIRLNLLYQFVVLLDDSIVEKSLVLPVFRRSFQELDFLLNQGVPALIIHELQSFDM
mmetsp:Transcript_9923/g.9814  ORF Transcript_9923/g.9814 Transcript_9923/m.9814 type:complete len:122 (-) Transcript_9923:1681-2046(-)